MSTLLHSLIRHREGLLIIKDFIIRFLNIVLLIIPLVYLVKVNILRHKTRSSSNLVELIIFYYPFTILNIYNTIRLLFYRAKFVIYSFLSVSLLEASLLSVPLIAILI